MSKLWDNFIGGIKILVNPRYLKDRMNDINHQIDKTSAMNIVAKAQMKELKHFAEKYPNDEILWEKVDFIDSLPADDKEDIVDLINTKKEIMTTPEQVCEICHAPYIFSCNHVKK